MITSVHTMFYSSQPEKLREFIRDKLGFKATDVGEGWLIFKLPAAEMGCHPEDNQNNCPSGTPYLSFICDNIEKTVGELKSKGVEFTSSVTDKGWGLACNFKMPGDFEVELYQPKYKLD